MPRPDADLERELNDLGWLRRLARSLVRDDAAADDVVQETAAAALRAGPPRPRSVRAWLAAVARNAARRSHRDARRRAARESAVARPEASPGASETSERLDSARALLAAVEALEEPYRTAVRLRWLDGLPPREVAARLGVSPEVAWKRLSRGLAMLRARLDRDRGGRRGWVLAMADLGGLRSDDVPLGPAEIIGFASRFVAAGVVALTLIVAASRTLTAVGTGPATGGSIDPAPNRAVRTAAAPAGGSEPVAAAGREPVAIARRSRARVGASESPDATLALPADAASLPEDRIVGRVVAPGGDPAVGVVVTRRTRHGPTGVAVRTDGAGRFVLPQPGVDAPGGELQVTSTQWAILLTELPRIHAGEIRVGDLVLGERHPIEGLVVTADGSAVPGARVSLGSPRDGTQVGSEIITGRDGRFRLEEAGAGTWRVTVQPPPGEEAQWIPPFHVRTVGESRDLVRVTIHRRTPATATREVVVIDAAGEIVELEPARLRAGFLAASLASFEEGRPVTSVTLSSGRRGRDSGRIDLGPLDAGDWLVAVRANGTGTALARFRVDPSDSTGRVPLVLGAPGAVRVHVTSDEPAADVRSWFVMVAPLTTTGALWDTRWSTFGIGGTARLTTDGVWELAGLAPANYALVLFSRDWCAEPVSVGVVPGEIVSAQLHARRGGRVEWAPNVEDGFEAEVAFSEGDGPWRVGCEILGSGTPQSLVLPAFPPGRLAWRIRVAPTTLLAREGRRLTTYTGDVSVPEGGCVRLPSGPFQGVR